MKNFVAFFGGAGIGALLGLLIGMSVSGTVGVVVGALTSVILVLLGLKDNADNIQQALRVGAFGTTCTIFILIGVYLRVNHVFSPTISEEVAKWTEGNNYSLKDARQFVAYQRLAIMPSDFKVDTARKSDADAGTDVLYATHVTISECEKTRGYMSFSEEEQIKAWKRLKGPWEKAATHVESDFPAAERKKALQLVQNCLCDK